MVDGSRLANEQRIVLHDAAVVLGTDDFGLDSVAGGGPNELLHRAFVRGGLLVLRRPQDREIVAQERLPWCGVSASEVGLCALDDEVAVRFGNLRRGAEPQVTHPPFSGRPLEAADEDGRGKLIEQGPGDAIVLLREVAAEVDTEREVVALQGGEGALHLVVEVFGYRSEQG
jgi:hypothetical protein